MSGSQLAQALPGTDDVVRGMASALQLFDANWESLAAPSWLASPRLPEAEEAAAAAEAAEALDMALGPTPSAEGDDPVNCTSIMRPAVGAHLRELARARRLLSFQAAEVLQAAMVSSGFSDPPPAAAAAAAPPALGAAGTAGTAGAASAASAAAAAARPAAPESAETMRCLSGSASGDLHVWRSDCSAPERSLCSEAGVPVRALLLLPDGLLVSASADAALRLWRLADGVCLRAMTGHTDVVRGIASVCPPGEPVPGCAAAGLVIVSASEDATLRLWPLSDAAAGASAVLGGGDASDAGHAAGVTCVAALAGGCLASGSRDATVRVWALSGPLAGACSRVLRGHVDHVYTVCDLSGGRLASGSEDATVRVWTAATGACLRVLDHTGAVYCVAALATGTVDKVLSGASDHTVRIWDAFGGQLDQELRGHTDGVCALAVLRRGCASKIVSAGMDGTLCVWHHSAGSSAGREAVLRPDIPGGSVFALAALD